MPVQHIKTLTQGDTSDTSVVRPTDWNSNHIMVQNFGGNTLGTSQISGQDLYWAGGTNISLSANGSTISVNGWPHLSTYEPYPMAGMTSTTVGGAIPNSTANVAFFFPFAVNEPISFGALNMIFSASFSTVGTSSGRQSGGFQIALYTRGTGANSTTIGSFESTSWSYAVTGNNSSYTVSQPTSTNFTSFTYSTTASAGVNMTSAYTGLKLVAFPLNTSLSPGNYWLCVIGTNSTSSVNVGISMSFVGGVVQNATNIAPFGSYSSAFSRESNPFADWNIGAGSVTSASYATVPASMALSDILAGGAIAPYMKFWST